jgi:hypothetical protein
MPLSDNSLACAGKTSNSLAYLPAPGLLGNRCWFPVHCRAPRGVHGIYRSLIKDGVAGFIQFKLKMPPIVASNASGNCYMRRRQGNMARTQSAVPGGTSGRDLKDYDKTWCDLELDGMINALSF